MTKENLNKEILLRSMCKSNDVSLWISMYINSKWKYNYDVSHTLVLNDSLDQ